MQEFKGTPGPWVVMNTADIFTSLGAKNSEGIEASRNDGWHVADCDMGGLCLDEVAANACLIAAAPDLLEALQQVVAISDRKHEAWDKAHAAIAKALNTDTTER
jgi:hypothetical protein